MAKAISCNVKPHYPKVQETGVHRLGYVPPGSAIQHMDIDHGDVDIPVPEERLDYLDINHSSEFYLTGNCYRLISAIWTKLSAKEAERAGCPSPH